MDCKDCNAHLAVIGKQKTLCHQIEKLETEEKDDINLVYETMENKTKDKVSMRALSVIVGIFLTIVGVFAGAIGSGFVADKELTTILGSLKTDVKVMQVQLKTNSDLLTTHLVEANNMFREIRGNIQTLEGKFDKKYNLKKED